MKIERTSTLGISNYNQSLVDRFCEEKRLPVNEYRVYSVNETDTGLILFHIAAFDLQDYYIDSDLNRYDVSVEKEVRKM